LGCDQSPETPQQEIIDIELDENIGSIKGCSDCHPYTLDSNHNFACTICHNGNPAADSEESAHQQITSHPSSPANMEKFCGGCHKDLVTHINKSKHFTLHDEINLVRDSFGASEEINTPQFLANSDQPSQILDLVDDMLRRRCLRCHVYSAGDQYSAVSHGTGCAACHLKFSAGSLVSHEFIKSPDDQICLSCHYGNYVGADYYGLYEHDFNWEYHTPFNVNSSEALPYGVNYHNLRPDIHQLAGLACIDCHSGSEIMSESSQPISCLSCHFLAKESGYKSSYLKESNNAPPTLLTKITNRSIPVPQIKEDHSSPNISCQVCHAQWSFADYGTHLLRLDYDDYDSWLALTKQGSSEIEQFLEYNLFYDNDEIEPLMTDKFSGEQKPGIWLKGFEQRRWEDIPTCKDENGTLQVCRPILNLHLSYVNQDGELIFDAVPADAPNSGMRPYAPHTIGKAGAFKKLSNIKPKL
jgi:hypothetical protein